MNSRQLSLVGTLEDLPADPLPTGLTSNAWEQSVWDDLDRSAAASCSAPKAIRGSPDPQHLRIAAIPTIGSLLASKQEVYSRLHERLKHASYEQLFSQLRIAARGHLRLGMWAVSQELSRRGIPPVFRALPTANPAYPEELLDLIATDLNWIAQRWPRHRTRQVTWRKFIDPSKTDRIAKAIFISSSGGTRDIWKITNRLDLTEEQMVECSYLKKSKYSHQFRNLVELRSDMREEFKYQQGRRMRGWQNTDEARAERKFILERRIDAWMVGEMAGWKPTHSATLYNAYRRLGEHPGSGEERPMTRQRFSGLKEDIQRDLYRMKKRKREEARTTC